jgi:ATPase subunit of ABC transporter with duplicated ATPase domains
VLQAKEIARLQTVVDRFGAKATKAAMAHSKEKQIVRLEAQARRQGRPHSAREVSRSSGQWRHRRQRSRVVEGVRRPPVFEDVSFDVGTAIGCWCSA